MKLIQRLRNIWKLGELPTGYTIPENYKENIPIGYSTVGFGETTGTTPSQLAQIVSMKPIEEDIEKLLQETNEEKKDDNN